MIPVDIVGVSLDGEHRPVVILRHEDRILLILVGPAEAEAIHVALIERDFGRPMTHDLICNLLAGLRGELRSVNIYKLENDTFYAFLDIEQKSVDGGVDQMLRVDSRPSDGIAIACRTKSPIFVAGEVMDEASHSASILEPAEDDEEGEEEDDAPDFDA